MKLRLQHISANLLDIENVPLDGHDDELNLRHTKWLLNCSFNPDKSVIEKHIAGLSI